MLQAEIGLRTITYAGKLNHREPESMPVYLAIKTSNPWADQGGHVEGKPKRLKL